MLDHPRSAIDGISSVLKFGFDPIYSFGDIAIFLFCRFGLKIPIHAHFGEGILGIFSPNDVIHRYNSVQRFDLGVFPRKKDRTGQSNKKVTKW